MLSRALLILCITCSFVQAWKFRIHKDEEDKPPADWRFEGDDGSWTEPSDLRSEKYNSEKECHSDSPQVKLTVQELAVRNRILQKVRPWKVPKSKDADKVATGVAPTEINTVYYFNDDGDTHREHFMNLQLKAKVSPEVTVQRVKLANISDGDMILSDEIQNELKLYSEDTLAEYMKGLEEADRVFAVNQYISTMRLLNEIQKQNPRPNELFVILEDDVQLTPDWEEDLLGHMKHLPQDWDVARFVYWGAKRCQDLVPVNGQNSPWYEARGWKVKNEATSLLSFTATTPPPLSVPHDTKEVGEAWYAGNQAYVIRAGSIPDILAQAKALPVMHVDGVLSSGHQEGLRKFDAFEVPWTWGIHSYALSMPLGHQVPHDEIERNDRPSLGSEF